MPTKQPSLNEEQWWLLEQLAGCENGTGMPCSDTRLRKLLGRMITFGYVWSIAAGGIKGYILTDKGRSAFKAHQKQAVRHSAGKE